MPRLVVNTTAAALDDALDGLGLACIMSYQTEPRAAAGPWGDQRSGMSVTAVHATKLSLPSKQKHRFRGSNKALSGGLESSSEAGLG
jgi:hypothetical protein